MAKPKTVKLDKIESLALKIALAQALNAGILEPEEGSVQFINTKQFVKNIMDRIDMTYNFNQDQEETA